MERCKKRRKAKPQNPLIETLAAKRFVLKPPLGGWGLKVLYLCVMLLRIKVKPNSKTDDVIKEPDGSIKVRIKAPPVEGKANKYLVEFLAGYFGLSKSKVTLLKGETNQFKTLEIEADEEAIKAQLEKISN